jgi:hypothetical protein
MQQSTITARLGLLPEQTISSIQDPTIVLKMDPLALVHNAQASFDRAFTGGQDRSHQQDFGVFPNGLEKSNANSTSRGNNSANSIGIWKISLGGKFLLSLCGLPLLFKRSKKVKIG